MLFIAGIRRDRTYIYERNDGIGLNLNFSCSIDLIDLPLRTISKEEAYVMPKMKTHSSAKKRFKITGSGKVKRFQAKTSLKMR